jgi:lactoylglutathione lyase
MKKFLILAFAVLTIGVAQRASAQTANPAVLNHIAVFVADLKTSTDFYGDLFNLEKLAEPFHDGKHTWFSLGPKTALHIIAGAKVRVDYPIDEHLCFSVPSVDEFIKKLKAKNTTYGNFAKAAGQVTLRPDGVHQIYFQDPDGHWIEVNDAKQ